MFLHPIGVSLAEPFNLVSNVWHVEIMMQNVIGNVPRRALTMRYLFRNLSISMFELEAVSHS